MYIREVKSRLKGKEYRTFRLVESYKTKEGKPRQRVIFHLGNIEVPKNRWKELAYLLEQRVSGQITFNSLTPELDDVADALFARAEFAKAKSAAQEQRAFERDLVRVDLNSIIATDSRTLGAELVADHMWEMLGFEEILCKCGLRKRQISVAKALIIGRLLNPSSELETHKWLNSRTALIEMLPTDIAGVGKDIFYETADALYKHREKLEFELYNKETSLFSLERKLFLFDLTNTYFEGAAKANEIAKYGKSKEKRMDCPLVALALVVDANGFPVYSHVYEGNQSEPKTLADVLGELKKLNGVFLDGKKPMLIMDRGIATTENIALLKENEYLYTVIERSPKEKDYRAEYEELKELLSQDDIEGTKTAGWAAVKNSVFMKKTMHEGLTRVLSFSMKRESKEQAMDQLKEQRFLEDIEKLCVSVEKGNIILASKVGERIGRLLQKYAGISGCYDINIEYAEDNQQRTKGIKWTKKTRREQRSTLSGCYVIETNAPDVDAEEIWHNYMTLTRVEAAFQDLKSELGMRPIYHQKEERTKSHLFIGVLAYHLLVGIEQVMRQNNDSREWKTIKAVLSTHQRTTVILMGEDKTVYHIRVSGKPETEHAQIYKYFGLKDKLKRIKSTSNKESSD
jgi:transposase